MPTIEEMRAAQSRAKQGQELAKEEISKFRTFQHLYAGANTIMPSGKKLVFGGHAGNPGTYVTKKEDEIEFLEGLSEMSGSMITEVKVNHEGRTIVVEDEAIKNDVAAAVADSRANSAADVNPAIVAARENLSKNIAQS